MRVGPLLALALVTASAASPAKAQTFEHFRTFCLETGGEAERANAAAVDARWQADPRGEGVPAEAGVRLWSDPATGTPAAEILMVGHVPLANTIHAPSCSVLGQASLETLRDAVTGWAGFTPERTGDGEFVWVYTVSANRPVPQRELVNTENDQFIAAARTRGRLHMIHVGQAQAGPFVLHAYVDPDATIAPPR